MNSTRNTSELYTTSRAERLKELNEEIAVATLARRYATTREERARAEAMLERVTDEKWLILGV